MTWFTRLIQFFKCDRGRHNLIERLRVPYTPAIVHGSNQSFEIPVDFIFKSCYWCNYKEFALYFLHSFTVPGNSHVEIFVESLSEEKAKRILEQYEVII